jgi:predicted tellurium resistance membrane protein TerC
MPFEFLSEPATYVSLFTLTALEIVLGIDNVIFISILTGKLPKEQQRRARNIGLSLALVMRVGLLLSISWVVSLTGGLFTLFNHEYSGRDLILLAGGVFLIGKAAHEIYDKLEVEHHEQQAKGAGASFAFIIGQILVLDMVFSLDSVITAVGMAQHLAVMITAVMVAVGFMLVFAGRISDFVEQHPSLKILALSFLLLIGTVLVADGLGQHISKGYVYFAMAFAVGVELLNFRLRRKTAPVALHHRFEDDPTHAAARGQA